MSENHKKQQETTQINNQIQQVQISSSAAKKVKKRASYCQSDNPRSYQLCWNCKRATNADNFYCPWAAEGIPVDGWEATPGKEYFSYHHDGTKRFSIGKTWNITKCPLFVKDKPFFTKYEAAVYIADKLDMIPGSVYQNMDKYIEKFEKITGEKLPQWIKSDD